MATTLKEANFSGSSGSHFKIRLSYDLTQSMANNTSTIKYYLYVISMDGYSGSGATATGYINGASVGTFTSIGVNQTKPIGTKSVTVTHNVDGTKSVNYSASVDTLWTIGDASLSGTLTLPTIKRQATITSAPNFTDEQNPTIKYSNPAGNSVSSLQVCIASPDGMTTYAGYRDVSKTGSSYTFNLTEAERYNLRYASRNSNTLAIRFFIKTVISSTTLRNSVQKTMTIVNANPTEVTELEETNQKVITLLGSDTATAVIQNVSQIRLTSTPTTYKYATVSRIQFTNGTTSIVDTSSPYEAVIVPINGVFQTIITDSRSNIISNLYGTIMLPYIPVDITSYSFKRVNPTSSNIYLNAEIRYKQATFNGHVNSPTIQWKIGEEGTLNTLSSEDYTIDTENDLIIISNLLLSNALPYTDQGNFYLYAKDLLTEDTENMFVSKGIPTFEAGEHDFQVNGKLYLADENRENRIDIGNNVEKNAMTIRSNNSNINLSVGTAWQYYNIPLSISNTTEKVGSGKISYDSTNKCIVIGEETNHIKVSGSALIRGIASTLLFGIKLNSSVVAQAYGIATSSTSIWQSIYSTDMILSVSEGDRIYLVAGAGATGTLNIGSANYTYLTVEKLD